MSLNLLLSSSGKSFELQSNNINEIKNVISSEINSKDFILVKENGKKIKKNLLEEELISEDKKTILTIPITPFNSPNPSEEKISKYLKNQLLVKKIFDNLYKMKIEKINLKMIHFNEIYEDFNDLMNRIKFDYSSNFEKFNELFSNRNEEIKIIIEKIEKAKNDFTNRFSIFKEKFEKCQTLYNNTQKNYEKIINEDKILYDGDSSVSYSELLNLYDKNKLLLNKLIDNEINPSNNDFYSEMKELNLLKENLNESYSLSMIVFNFIEKKEEIEDEIKRRKKFDNIYNTLFDYLKNTLLKEEKERKKEFIKKFTKTSVSIETYNNLIKFLVNNDKESNENLLNKEFEKLFNEFKQKLKNLKENLNPQKDIENEEVNGNDIKEELLKILSENLKISIDDKNSSIHNLIQRISDETKNLLIDPNTNQSLKFSLMFGRGNSSNNLYETNSENQELNPFINKYEDIIYFYNTLIKFIQEFYSKLNKQKPEITDPICLTDFIEKIFKENLQLKMKLNYLISKLNNK